MDKDAKYASHKYLCSPVFVSQERVAEECEKKGYYNFADAGQISDFINSSGFRVSDTVKYGNQQARNCPDRRELRAMNLSVDEFEKCFDAYLGKTTRDFIEHVEAVRAGIVSPEHKTGGYIGNSDWVRTEASEYNNPMRGADVCALDTPHSVNKRSSKGHNSDSDFAITFAVIICIALVVGIVFLFRSCTADSPKNIEKNILAVQNFVPAGLGGMTIGEFFESINADGEWILVEKKPIKVRFVGSTDIGYVRANFELADKNGMTYSFYLDEEMFVFHELFGKIP